MEAYYHSLHEPRAQLSLIECLLYFRQREILTFANGTVTVVHLVGKMEFDYEAPAHIGQEELIAGSGPLF